MVAGSWGKPAWSSSGWPLDQRTASDFRILSTKLRAEVPTCIEWEGRWHGPGSPTTGRTPYHRPLLCQLKSFSCYCSTSWWAQELLRGRVAGADLSEGQWGREPTDSHQGVWERVPPSACPCTRQWEGRSSGSGGHPLSFPSFLCPSSRAGRGPRL